MGLCDLLCNPIAWAVVIVFILILFVLVKNCRGDEHMTVPPKKGGYVSGQGALETAAFGAIVQSNPYAADKVIEDARKLTKMKKITDMEGARDSDLADLHYASTDIEALGSSINAGKLTPIPSSDSKSVVMSALNAQSSNYSREKEHKSDRNESRLRVAAQEDQLAVAINGGEHMTSRSENFTSGGLEDVLAGAEHMSEHLTADDDYIEDNDEVISDRVSQGDIVAVIQAPTTACKRVYNRGNSREYFCGRRIYDGDKEKCPYEDKYGKDSVCAENHPNKKAFGRRDKVYVDVSQYMHNYEENVHDPTYYHSLY